MLDFATEGNGADLIAEEMSDSNVARQRFNSFRQQALLDVVAKIRRSLDLGSIFQSTATEVRQLLNADRVVVYRFLADSNHCLGEIVSEDVLPDFSSALAAMVQDPCFGKQEQAQKYRDGHVSKINDVLALNLNPCYAQILARFEIRANLVVPLLQADNLWGLLCIHQCSAPRYWQDLEIQFAKEIGLHLSVAIQQAEFVNQLQQQSESLNQAVQKAVAREKALAQTIDKIRRSLDLDMIFQTTVKEVQELLQADRAVIYRFNPDWSGEFVSESVASGWTSLVEQQYKDLRIGINVSDCSVQMLTMPTAADSYLVETDAEMFVRGQMFRVCNDIYAANFSDCYVKVLESYQAKAYIITAIFQAEKLWGLVAVYQNSVSRIWQEEEIKFLVQISGQLGVAIRQATLLEQSRQRSQSLQTTLEQELRKQAEQLSLEAQQERHLARVIKLIRQTLEPDSIFSASSELRLILACDRLTIYRFNSDWSGGFIYESLEQNQISLLNPESPWSDRYLQSKQGWIYQQHESSIVANIDQMGLSPQYIEFLAQHQIRSYVSVPIFVGNHLWGLLNVYQHSDRQWQSREVRLLNQVSHQIGVALQQAELLIQEKQTAANADAANRAKSQFLAHMSHELRTPLNSILGFAQLLKRDSEQLKPHYEYLGIIVRSGEHLLTLINDVLEMSKIEAGQMNLNQDSFDLSNLLSSIKEMFSLKAESKGLQLTFNCAESVPRFLKTDELKLRQILINLLGNGIKFTEVGEVTLRIYIGQGLGDQCLIGEICNITFEVEDTGFGIAANQIDTLFEPFIQSDSGRKYPEGTGLGLTISKRFVEFLGGKISVSSEIDKGSLFKFTIPVIYERQLIDPQKAPLSLVLAPNQSPPRVLICEDHPESRLMIENLIATVGFEVRSAANGEEAIALWQLWQPRLIWMDMRMPIVDGYEATRQIRAIEQQDHISLNQAVKIIGLTASTSDKDHFELLAAGCDDFMVKPYQSERIFAKMGEHLNLTYIYPSSNRTDQNFNDQNFNDRASQLFNQANQVNSESQSELVFNQMTLEPNQQSQTTLHSGKVIEITKKLARMPKKWQERMYLAARAADEDAIAVLLRDIPESQQSLLEYLSDLINCFQLDQIVRMLQPLI